MLHHRYLCQGQEKGLKGDSSPVHSHPSLHPFHSLTGLGEAGARIYGLVGVLGKNATPSPAISDAILKDTQPKLKDSTQYP